MQIKSIVAGAASALAAGVGFASAAAQSATLAGVEAKAMSAIVMGDVRGAGYVGPSITTIFVGADPVRLPPPDRGDKAEFRTSERELSGCGVVRSSVFSARIVLLCRDRVGLSVGGAARGRRAHNGAVHQDDD